MFLQITVPHWLVLYWEHHTSPLSRGKLRLDIVWYRISWVVKFVRQKQQGFIILRSKTVRKTHWFFLWEQVWTDQPKKISYCYLRTSYTGVCLEDRLVSSIFVSWKRIVNWWCFLKERSRNHLTQVPREKILLRFWRCKRDLVNDVNSFFDQKLALKFLLKILIISLYFSSMKRRFTNSN